MRKEFLKCLYANACFENKLGRRILVLHLYMSGFLVVTKVIKCNTKPEYCYYKMCQYIKINKSSVF